MCLAIPGKIESFVDNTDPQMAIVNFGGIRKTVCMTMLPEANVNDYVIVHVGFAISVLDEEEAKETLRLLSETGDLNKEFGES